MRRIFDRLNRLSDTIEYEGTEYTVAAGGNFSLEGVTSMNIPDPTYNSNSVLLDWLVPWYMSIVESLQRGEPIDTIIPNTFIVGQTEARLNGEKKVYSYNGTEEEWLAWVYATHSDFAALPFLLVIYVSEFDLEVIEGLALEYKETAQNAEEFLAAIKNALEESDLNEKVEVRFSDETKASGLVIDLYRSKLTEIYEEE